MKGRPVVGLCLVLCLAGCSSLTSRPDGPVLPPDIDLGPDRTNLTEAKYVRDFLFPEDLKEGTQVDLVLVVARTLPGWRALPAPTLDVKLETWGGQVVVQERLSGAAVEPLMTGQEQPEWLLRTSVALIQTCEPGQGYQLTAIIQGMPEQLIGCERSVQLRFGDGSS